MTDQLNIQTNLRAANIARQAEWDPSDKITLTYRLNELAGETGEACNVGKKIERERLGIRGSRDTVEHLAEELADVVICADLVAMAEGIDLDAAVIAKFNATSEKVGLRTRLVSPPQGAVPVIDGFDPELTVCDTSDGGGASTIWRLRAEEAPAGAGAWIKRALRFIDLCDADAADYQDREMHEDAADLTREGFALFDMGDDACIADLKHASLRAQPRPAGGLTVTLVETSPHLPAAGSMAIRKWDNHGLPSGTHHLYASPDAALKAAKEALRHYRCSCEAGHCAMSADDTDTPVDEQMCGRKASKALAVLEGGAA